MFHRHSYPVYKLDYSIAVAYNVLHRSKYHVRIVAVICLHLNTLPFIAYSILHDKVNTLMCLSIGTPKNNKFSICSKWKIHYFQVSQNLGRVQPHYNVLEYWDN